MLKYIFGGIFVALAWAAAIVFSGVSVLLWAAVAVTIVVVVGLATWAIVKAIATKRAASAIEAGLGELSGKSSIRPDQQAEITAMQVEFQKAIAGLKSSRLGHKGRDALGILPWYIIIGPPGAGKTTALRSSGLQFPYAKGGKVKGVGGTRNCDWWLTNEAIILDTAGRWATQDDDHEEWLAFLDLLRKTRPKKPVNGILLAVSLLDLEGGEEEMAALAKALRDRLDEVTGRLEMVVPVYLLVTKADLVPGFIEMFGDLRDRDRGQIWGVSLPLMSTPDERQEILTEQLQELFDVVAARSFGRMCEERRVDARFKIFEFSQQLEACGRNLSTLVADLFAENVYQDAPILRGVYFTSGTQEGRPIDRVMQNMAAAFGVSGRAASVAITKPKSYFLRDVFTGVVFPDQAAAVRSTRVMRKERTRKLLLTAGAFLLAAGFLFLPIRSYLSNAGYAREARRAIDKLATGKANRDGLVSAEAFESIEELSKRLAEGGSSSALFPRAAVTKQLHAAVERLVVRPILRADLIKAAAQGGLGASELMDALVLHLLLTQDKQPEEPTPRTERWEAATKQAAEKAAARWISLTNQPAAGRAPRVIENLVIFYAGGIMDPADMIDRDKKFVAYARMVLIGSGDDPLAEIVNDPGMPRDLKAIDLLGSAVVLLSPQQGKNKKEIAVRGAFTPAGYQVVKKRLGQLEKAQDDDENSWVLGKERKVRDARAIARIQADYFVQYVASWKRFLLSLSVQEPTTLDEARALVKRLNAEKPFEATWRNISDNLVIKEESLTDRAFGALKGVAEKKVAAKTKGAVKKLPDGEADEDDRDPGVKQIEAAFEGLLRFGSVKPTGFEQYGQILTELAGAMGEQGMPDTKAFQTAIKTARTNLSNLIARYDDKGWEQGMLEKILMPPLRGAEVAVVGASADSANRKWCETVFVAFDQLLAGKYPFAGGRGSGTAKIADIEKFFQPNAGTLWQYFTDSLAADIERVGTTFRLKDGAGVRYRDDFLKFLTQAAELTGRIFARDPGKVGMPVGVHIRPSAQYSKIILDLGTKKITGLNTVDRWDEFIWPVRRANLRLFVKNDEIEAIGPRDESEWALFYLLAQGTNPLRNGEFVSLTYPAAGGQTRITVDFKPEGIRETFGRFGLPRSITAGGGACRK